MHQLIQAFAEISQVQLVLIHMMHQVVEIVTKENAKDALQLVQLPSGVLLPGTVYILHLLLQLMVIGVTVKKSLLVMDKYGVINVKLDMVLYLVLIYKLLPLQTLIIMVNAQIRLQNHLKLLRIALLIKFLAHQQDFLGFF